MTKYEELMAKAEQVLKEQYPSEAKSLRGVAYALLALAEATRRSTSAEWDSTTEK